jgi:PBP1b-binding outer membrane lipoprotein LpoB
MTKFFGLLSVLLLILFIASCASTQKIEALKPEPDDAQPLVYQNESSIVNMPISIKIKDIENQTNKMLNGLIYEDNNIEDDNYTVKVWKQAPINIGNIDGKLQTMLPLKALVNYRIGTNKLGLNLFDTREINLNGKINLSSTVALNNWKLNTQTELQSLDWTESPSINIAGKNIPITYLVAPAIKIFKSKIERSIDDAIKKSMDFKPNVLDALEKICTPSQINANYDTWLRINPIELYTTDAKLKNQSIEMQMGLKCNIETIVGKKPENKLDRNKILLKPIIKMPNTIEAHVVAVSTFEDASRIINKNFQGKNFGADGKQVTVQSVKIWHKNNKMIIALEMIGSLNGTIYLNGFPQYNAETKEIYFDQLDYVLDTKSKLMRTANWLASGLVLKKLQQNCRYSIKPNLDEAKQNMMQYLKNYSPMPGIFVNGSIDDIDFQKIQLTNKAVLAFLNIMGNVRINVDGLQ